MDRELQVPPTITVVDIEWTCIAAPSQWEGRTTDGRWVYIRYRHGRLRVGLGHTIEEAVHSEGVFGTEVGDDGFLGYAELRSLLPEWIVLPAVERWWDDI